MSVITLGGVATDMDDPCALYTALYAAKIKLLAGQRVEEAQIKSPVTQRVIKLSVPNMRAIDEELLRLSAACSLKQGKRTRYAKTIGYC